MREFREAPRAFLFFGVFTGFPELFDRARVSIVRDYGPLHPRGESPAFPFPPTETYGRTMGPGLLRKFFVLARPWPQDRLAEVKRRAVAIEAEIAAERTFPVDRPINIDPGLLNDCRIILASTKDCSHRIYRGLGVWEEVTLRYERGAYRTLPWTYRDFASPEYHEFFEPFRREILERLRSERDAGPGTPP